MEVGSLVMSVVPVLAAVSLVLPSASAVEARDKSGRLFGFERTAALSTEPAEAVMRAAEAFGQEDDITVVTLARTPVSDELAAELTGLGTKSSGG